MVVIAIVDSSEMAGPTTEEPTKYECGNKCKNNQYNSSINNAKFYKSMKEFLKIETAYYIITKIINMS